MGDSPALESIFTIFGMEDVGRTTDTTKTDWVGSFNVGYGILRHGSVGWLETKNVSNC